MSLSVQNDIIDATKRPAFKKYRELRYRQEDREVDLPVARLDDGDLRELRDIAVEKGDKKSVRAIEAILGARTGVFNVAVPNFKAFEGILRAFLAHDIQDGWLYVRGDDGKLYPELVTEIRFDDGRRGNRKETEPRLTIKTAFYARSEARGGTTSMGVATGGHQFAPADVTNKRVADALAAMGIFKENADLRREYDATMTRHKTTVQPSFAKQFRFTGVPVAFMDRHHERRGQHFDARRVVHDLEAAEYAAMKPETDSELFELGTGFVPEHPLVRVFDLRAHEFMWVHSDTLTPYVYDKSLRDKLVLPRTHRGLLDVLTTDLDAFTEDIIEGKAAGNIVLCQGAPGLGKTLTAEVYAELIEAPLYMVHSGTLGVTAVEVEKSLQEVFALAKRWNAPILLDEADVFVMRRGMDLQQNAIVAVFLRALEYVDSLMFMTTNRASDIDDAIKNRCAAILEYDYPEPQDAAAIWGVMAKQFDVQMDASMIAGLVAMFPQVAPRDIKLLLRLALRVSLKREESLSLDLFRQCAMFRAVKIASEEPVAA